MELTGQYLIGSGAFFSFEGERVPRVKTDEKLEEILEASSRVFSEKDFHEVLIDEIAEVGGIGKGTVYRYFRTKEDLYFATILRGLDRLDLVLSNGLPQEASPTRRLERIAREMLTFFWNQRSLLMLLYRDERTLRSRRGPLRERHDRLVRLVKEAILEGIERREYRGVDPSTAAELFLGMIRGINIFRRDEDTVDALVAEIVGVFTRGVVRPEEGRWKDVGASS
jgi:AcrR family transcriptional regulator